MKSDGADEKGVWWTQTKNWLGRHCTLA